MSLYHEAAEVLNKGINDGSSLKSIIFSRKDWKSDPKTLFALTANAAAWSEALSEAIEKSGILGIERQLTPILSLLLTHDLLISKRGVALPAKHGLHATISKHKARLSAELTKIRIRHGCSTLDALRSILTSRTQGDPSGSAYPRWVRINTLLTTLDEQLTTTFAAHTPTPTLNAVLTAAPNAPILHVDRHIANLVALPPNTDLTTHAAYKSGHLILQDKASCMPATLLSPPPNADLLDACAAPGNKTTHLAALLPAHDTPTRPSKIIATEKSPLRSQTLAKMTALAGASSLVSIKAKQDFMALDPSATEFANVHALLLDPSCSGSGIVGRVGGSLSVHLPAEARGARAAGAEAKAGGKAGKKRKRGGEGEGVRAAGKGGGARRIRVDAPAGADPEAEADEEEDAGGEDDAAKLATRLQALAGFQLRLLVRAMEFPAARRITYSTCSVHRGENEDVVVEALASGVAAERGWRVLRREEQVEGLREWGRRGLEGVEGVGREVAEACLRCVQGDGEGTMGFFVVGFVRDEGVEGGRSNGWAGGDVAEAGAGEGDEEEWGGFSDED